MRWRRHKDREQDLDRELRSHLELEAEEQRASGLAPDEARNAARRSLGNPTFIKEEVSDMWAWASLERLARDLRYALRSARKSPGFTAIAVATLALGIGVNTAMFSVVNTVLLRKPQYADPDRLVSLHQNFPRQSGFSAGTCPAEYLDYRDRNRAFTSVAGYEDAVFDLTGGTEAVQVQAQRATHNLFSTLGISPFAGRTFTPADDQPGAARVLIMSHEFWQRRFGASPQTLGSIVRLNEQPYTVVGIMPPGFEFPFTPASVGEPPVLWVPMAFTAKEIEDRAAEFPVHIVARLQPGISIAQAGQDVDRVAADFQREHPDIYAGNLQLRANLNPLGAADLERTRRVLLTLAGAVLLVLLIACANVMSLLMARAAARQREMAVRNALGASVQRLVAQLLTEGLLLTLFGAALGCALAEALIKLAADLWPSFLAGLSEVRIDSSALAFILGISVITGALCGLAPALRRTRPNIGAALKQGGRQGAAQERNRVREALVVFEVSSALVLLIGAGLLIHSFLEVLRVPVGFSPNGVVIARTTFNRQRYPSNDARREAERRMVQRIAALPGVTAVGLTTHIPLADDRQIGFILEGEDIHAARWADNALVSSDYFAAMGIALVRGRTFRSEDTPQSPLSAIVNESMSRLFWPNGDAIGKRIVWGGRKMTIVGIVADVHIKALESVVSPTIYSPVYQIESRATTSAVFIVRARTTHPGSLAPGIRDAIRSVDRDVPVFEIRTMDQIVSRSLTARRFAVALLSCFAILALALAVIGLYGVLSYAVAQRTSELGIRLALGATRGQVLRLVIGDGLRLTLIGVMIGAIVGGVAVRAMARLLFGVQTFDLASFAVAALTMLAIAVIASYVPAHRASTVDPLVSLRHE